MILDGKKHGADNIDEISGSFKKTIPGFFYSEENGCLFKGDSLEILKKIKDASVNLVFADPPYSIDYLLCEDVWKFIPADGKVSE